MQELDERIVHNVLCCRAVAYHGHGEPHDRMAVAPV
jgi:hypothetical protein